METAKRIYRPDELQPSEPIHPGEMLKDELEARGLSQRKFAGLIGMPYTAFNEIINGKRPISTDTALKNRSGNGHIRKYLDWLADRLQYADGTAEQQTCRRA